MQNLQNIEKILKDYTSRIPEVQHLNYWKRLKVLKMNSLQRRFERYKFNSLPKYLRGIKKCSVEEFKEKLDELMGRIPDEPKIDGLMPMNFHQSNSLIHQLPKRRFSHPGRFDPYVPAGVGAHGCTMGRPAP